MSYHKLKIQKHSHTSAFKLLEETYEYLDAISTDNKIMAIQELSDLYGVLKREANKYNISVKDLDIMSNLTEQVFINGYRNKDSLFDYLKNNHTSIHNFGLGFIQVKVGKSLNYNIYSKKLEKFKNWESPHTHKNTYISEILYGELVERLYKIQASGHCTNIRYCCNQETDMVKGVLVLFKELLHKSGEYYQREASEPHSVYADGSCITKVFKFLEYENEPIIYDGEKYEIPKMDEQDMWSIVEEVINDAKL